MQGNEGIRLGYVLAIEGCEYLLTDHPAPTATLIGWNTTDWSSVLTGLRIRGEWEQEIHPFKRDNEAGELTFEILPDDSDTFGTLVHKVAGGDQTEMTASSDASDGTIDVVSTSEFASSGTAYIGTERFTYTATTATQFQGTVNRGMLFPFSVDGGTANRMGRDHTIPSADFDVPIRPKVTEQPRTWIGKYVGLWAHRIVGGTWDSKAQAQLIFAGTIESIDDTETGATLVHCVHVKDRLNKTVLLHDQFRGKVREGVFLKAGWEFRAKERRSTAASPPVTSTLTTDVLTVVASGASGANEINEGYYTIGEGDNDLLSYLNNWLSDEEAVDGNIGALWSVTLAGTEETGRRIRISALFSATDLASVEIGFRMPLLVADFLGFENYEADAGQATVSAAGNGASAQLIIEGTQTPLRVLAGQISTLTPESAATITLESSMGTWFNNRDWLPEVFKETTEAGENWGVVSIGDVMLAFVKYASATSLTDVRFPQSMLWLTGPRPLLRAGLVGIDIDSDGYLEVRQVAMLSGRLEDIIPRLFASTGSAAYNHADYDEFPSQLGAAIPWELLGDDFENSLIELGADSAANDVLIILEKPTRLWEVLVPELLLRGAFLVWKSGVLRWTRWQTPSAAVTTHAFTENNKASADPNDAQRTTSQVTSEFLCNVLKVQYNRTALSGEYASTDEVRFIASIGDHGSAQPFTIAARNSYGQFAGTGDTVKALLADLVAILMPMFGKPIRRMRRTISFNYFEGVAPGDMCIVTDNFARDPETGTRGVTQRVGLIIKHSYIWPQNGSDLYGEVDIIFPDFDSVPVYAPSAQLDNGAANAGYAANSPSAGKSTLTFEEHEFSKASASVDISHFAAGDKVYIYEVDDTSAALSWTGIIESVDAGANTCVLDSLLASFDTTGATLYRMESRLYTDAAAQQISKAYAADDADLRIQNSRNPYEYGSVATGGTFSTSPGTQLPDLPSTTGGGLIFGRSDGSPITPAAHRSLIRFANNFIDYKGAVQHPVMHGNAGGSFIEGVGGTDWELTWLMPYYFGPGDTTSVTARTMGIAPMFASGNAGDEVAVRVTLSLYPPGGDSLIGVTFFGPRVQTTWTSPSITMAIGTVSNMTQMGRKLSGMGWLSVELRATGVHAGLPAFWGLSEISQNARGA